MKEKINIGGDLVVRQDAWRESPCSDCSGTPCCRNLPLAPLRLERQNDFVNLLLASAYNGLFPALKKSGEWTLYLNRDCRYLSGSDGKCSIHRAGHQSLICKSYDAHKCWYTAAFNPNRFSTMIPFSTGLLIWFEKRYGLQESRFRPDYDWDELCSAALDFKPDDTLSDAAEAVPVQTGRLSFKKSRSEQYLFFPPYRRPENINHFELLSFRLGFPGVYLALSDNCWAFMVTACQDLRRISLVRTEYYPVIGHKDGAFSFDSVCREQNPYSGAGEQWIILQRHNLEMLKALTVFDSDGRVRRLPSSTEILASLNRRSPDRAA